MALLVVAYPSMGAADTAWVQSIRQANDPQFDLITPHITLVFPTTALDAAALAGHVRAQAQRFQPLRLTMRCAIIVKDTFSPVTHVFLVPDEGLSTLVRWHDALYTGPLAEALRLDIPFIPHITIGAHAEPLEAKALADQVQHAQIDIHATISALDVLSYTPAGLSSIDQVPLE